MIDLLKKWFTKDEYSPVRDVGWYRKLLIWEFISFCITEYFKNKYPQFNQRAMPAQSFVDRDELYKKNHPFLFELNDKLENFDSWIEYNIFDKFRYPRRYYYNAIRDKTHIIPTGLKKGEWHDASERLFHGMFHLLIFFVDQEDKSEFDYYREELKDGKLDLTDHHTICRKNLLEAYNWYKHEYPEYEIKRDALYAQIKRDDTKHIFSSLTSNDPVRDEIYEDVHSLDWLEEGKKKYYMKMIVEYEAFLWN